MTYENCAECKCRTCAKSACVTFNCAACVQTSATQPNGCPTIVCAGYVKLTEEVTTDV